MTPRLVDIFLIFFLLFCGIGSYSLLAEFSNLSHALDILMATSIRLISLVFYRFFALSSQVGEHPIWLFYEGMIPGVFMAELVSLACYCSGLGGESLIAIF